MPATMQDPGRCNCGPTPGCSPCDLPTTGTLTLSWANTNPLNTVFSRAFTYNAGVPDWETGCFLRGPLLAGEAWAIACADGDLQLLQVRYLDVDCTAFGSTNSLTTPDDFTCTPFHLHWIITAGPLFALGFTDIWVDA